MLFRNTLLILISLLSLNTTLAMDEPLSSLPEGLHERIAAFCSPTEAKIFAETSKQSYCGVLERGHLKVKGGISTDQLYHLIDKYNIKLKSLDLSNLQNIITNKMLKEIMDKSSHIRDIKLPPSKNITDEGLQYLKNVKKIHLISHFEGLEYFTNTTVFYPSTIWLDY